MFARINEENTCVELIDFDPQGRFPKELIWVEVPEVLKPLVDNQYQFQEGEVQPPSVDYLRDQLKREVALKRFIKETGGVTLPSGVMALTDRESQGMINNVFQALASEIIVDTEFKTNNGWITVDKENLGLVARAVATHVRHCFKAERVMSDRIDTLDIPSLILLHPQLEADFLAAYTALDI